MGETSRHKFGARAWVALVLCCLVGPQVLAQGLWREDEQRLNVGIKLFPASLGADLALAQRLDDQGKLRILVVHDGDEVHAGQVVKGLAEVSQVGQYPIRVLAVALDDLGRFADQPVAALFVASPGIPQVVFREWAYRQKTLVFSPFAGDVERGAAAGVFVSDRILPYVNPRWAQKAGIEFKPFFLRIARLYED